MESSSRYKEAFQSWLKDRGAVPKTFLSSSARYTSDSNPAPSSRDAGYAYDSSLNGSLTHSHSHSLTPSEYGRGAAGRFNETHGSALEEQVRDLRRQLEDSQLQEKKARLALKDLSEEKDAYGELRRQVA